MIPCSILAIHGNDLNPIADALQNVCQRVHTQMLAARQHMAKKVLGNASLLAKTTSRVVFLPNETGQLLAVIRFRVGGAGQPLLGSKSAAKVLGNAKKRGFNNLRPG